MEQLKTRSKVKTFISKRYKVLFWNDDKTTFEFVMDCLIHIFEKSEREAMVLTLQVDQNGFAIAGDGYSLDIAETKKDQVITLAKENGFPFKVTVEEE